MNAQTKAKNHIRNWMEENHVSMQELSARAGKSPKYVRQFMERGGVSLKPFETLAPIVGLPDELLEDCRDEWDRYYKNEHKKKTKRIGTVKVSRFNQALQAWGRVA